jgi:hypothetical protein
LAIEFKRPVAQTAKESGVMDNKAAVDYILKQA